MSELPVISAGSQTAEAAQAANGKRLAIHVFRVCMFVSVLLLIRYAHRQTEFVASELSTNGQAIKFAQSVFPGATQILAFDSSVDGNIVVDSAGTKLGYILQTSPASDQIIGYSGPTNCLIAFDLVSATAPNSIRAIMIGESGDTIDHLEIVKQSSEFLDSFRGLGFDTTDQWQQIDGVSGATLTSYAIIAAVANRVSGTAPSLKFSARPNLENVKKVFPNAAEISNTDNRSIWNIVDDSGTELGFVLTTTPTTDHLSGYQGPTATLAGFDTDQKCIGIVVDQTYENEPYANYLDDDYGFQGYYSGKTLEQLAKMNPANDGFEGVSGATMTSMCVVDGLPIAASAALNPVQAGVKTATSTRDLYSYWADLLTALLVLVGVAFSFTKLSRVKWFRITYQVAVILILGFVSGHMLSQASIAGWSANSIPWKVAPGLVMLCFAALLIPVFSKHQTYCQHICPFGAIQQMSRNWLPWKLKIPKPISRVLNLIPVALLGFVVFVAMTRSKFNLASIEPFDGFAFRVAGWATIGILIAGLLISLVSPMAYCRFGCPTGATLNFLRFRADSHRLGGRDYSAMALVALALLLGFFS